MAKNTFKKPELPTSTNEEVRLNKYLSEAGVCSRREADRLIEAGKVLIDGEVASMGDRVQPGQKITVNGKAVEKEEKQILIAFHKPRGIVCTTEKKEPNNIIDYINYGKRIYPIGRLDKESEGLILLTNNGEIVNKILRGSNNHEKEYIVKVDKPISRAFLRGMISGVPILDTVTKPCEITTLDKYTFQIIITQGLNRQIRRMCEYFDYKVVELKRVRIMNIKLGRLNEGGYRNITELEYEELLELISESNNDPTFDNTTVEGIIHDKYQQKVREVKAKREIKRKEVIAKKELEKKELAKKEYPNKVQAKPGTTNKEYVKKEYVKRDQGKREFGNRDQGKKEFERRDQDKREFGNRDQGKREFERRDQSKREFGNRDQGKREFGNRDQGKREFERRDQGKSEFIKKDHDKKEFSKKENRTSYQEKKPGMNSNKRQGKGKESAYGRQAKTYKGKGR